jgi:type VI secretion system protein ImpG
MSASQDALLRAYRQELASLRQDGKEFARRHPDLAAQLQLGPAESGDPHVERLIESFAFLTARIQHAFDGDLPELSTTLLSQLAPHLLEPLPSLSIAHFKVDPKAGLPLAGGRIERDTQLLATLPSGQTVRFRTCSPVTLWPLRVAEASMRSPNDYPWLRQRRDVASVLRLRLRTLEGVRWSDLKLDRLRFFLDGPPEVSFRLHDLLTSEVRGVALAPEGSPSGLRLQPADSLRMLGFDPEEALLPAPPQTHPGYRLLQEYFAFPEKFLFCEVELSRECVQAAHQELEVLVLLGSASAMSLPLTTETLRTGCTPIINLFPKLAEPLRLDQRRTEYPLIPDQRRQREVELHSILSVSASAQAADSSRVVEPLFAWRHRQEREPRAFWYSRRQPGGGDGEGDSQVLLSFVDLDLNPKLPADQTLHVHTLCTHGALPSRLEVGAELQVEGRAPVSTLELLRRPTAPRRPPTRGASLWQLVSVLSLNHLSLAEGPQALEALKELLRLHDFSDGQLSEKQLRGMTGLSCRPAVARLRGRPDWRGLCRGLELTLTFDKSLYLGGSALLLGAVLSHFFGLYSSVESFTRLVARREQREEVWKTWPPMAGAQPLL